MPISFRRSILAGTSPLVPALLICLFSFPVSQAIGQDTPAPRTPFMKQLARIDLALSADGTTGSSVSGIEKRDNYVATSGPFTTNPAPGVTVVTTTVTSPTSLSIKPSSSVGELLALRYTVRPYVGFEFNVSNLRFSQDFNFVNTSTVTATTTTTTPPSTTKSVSSATNNPNYLFGGIQNAVREITFGYVAHLKYRPFGITPFAGAGVGTTRFKPTPAGGQSLPEQYRMTYYYTVGVEDNFPDSPFGMRLGFRQLVYLAPDFLQNYLTIDRRTLASEATIGVFVRF